MNPCFHCSAETDLLCSDCAIENEVAHVGLPVCSKKKCRDEHDEWHSRPPSISELEDALNRDAEVTILPNGRVIAQETHDGKPLTFRTDLGGEYAAM